MKRAHHPEQRALRRQAILDTASAMLAEFAYPEFRMADLAQRAEVAKGTLYLYFPTKEALFLALLEARLATSFQRMKVGLERLDPGAGAKAVAAVLVEPLAHDPRLPELLALLNGILEQNIGLEAVVAFKRGLLAQMAILAPLLENRLQDLPDGLGGLAFLRFNALIIGVQAMASRPPVVKEALALPDLASLDLPFLPTLESLLADLLAGMSRP